MIFNPEIHHRRSIRLKSYDYSLEGAYFVTMVCQNRENLFGDIKNGKMFLNDAGKMIETWWQKIPEKFPHAEIDEFVIIPNHLHGILSIVGANPCIRPDVKNKTGTESGDNTVSPLRKNAITGQTPGALPICIKN